jgi:hypothetical protein
MKLLLGFHQRRDVAGIRFPKLSPTSTAPAPRFPTIQGRAGVRQNTPALNNVYIFPQTLTLRANHCWIAS